MEHDNVERLGERVHQAGHHMSATCDFDVERFLALDVQGASREELDAAVAWAQRNAPAVPDDSGEKVAFVLQKIGNRHFDVPDQEPAISAYETGLLWIPPSNSFRAIFNNQLAGMFGDLGQFEKAIAAQQTALNDFRRNTPPQPALVLATSFNLGNICHHAGRLQEAEVALRQALSLVDEARAEPLGGDVDQWVRKIKLSLAQVLYALGQNDEAAQTFRDVLDASRAASDGQHYVEAGKGVAELAQARGSHDVAVAICRELIDCALKPSLKRTDNPRTIAKDYLRVAGTSLQSLAAMGRTDDARKLLEQTCANIDTGLPEDDWDTRSQFHRWRGHWWKELEDRDAQVASLQEALACARRCVPLHAGLVRQLTLDEIFALTDAKRTDEADAALRRAAEDALNREDPRQLAILEGNLAAVAHRDGDYERAVEPSQRSFDFFLEHAAEENESDLAQMGTLALRLHTTLGRASLGLERALQAKRRLQDLDSRASRQALASLNAELIHWYEMRHMVFQQREADQQAILGLLEENRRLSAALEECSDDVQYARWLQQAGRLAEAEQTLSALNVPAATDEANRVLHGWVDLADCHHRRENYADAARLYQRAAALAAGLEEPHYSPQLIAGLLREGQFEIAKNMAACMWESTRHEDENAGRPPQWKVHHRLAIGYGADHAAEAISELDQAIRSYAQPHGKDLARLNTDRRMRFASLIDKALERKQYAEAWQLAETMARSNASPDTLIDDAVTFFGPWAHKASVVCYYGLADKVLVVTLRPGVGDVRMRVLPHGEAISQRVSALYDKGFNAMLSLVERLEQIESSRPRGGAAMEEEASRLNQQLAALFDNPEIDELLAGLYDDLVEPVAEEFRAGRLVGVVAESYLACVPYYALYDSRRDIYLIDHGADLFLLPTLADLHQGPQRRKPEISRHGLLVVPNERLVGGAGESSREISAVRRFGPHRELLGRQATLANVSAGLGEAGFVHFVSHGVTNFKEPENAGIVLAGDDRLQGWRVRQLELPSLWMASLGSCYGASYREEYASERGATSLALEFIRAGAPLVVASLWFVGADAAEAMMEAFYRELDETLQQPSIGINVAAAFRRAVLETREQYPHIFDWGLFYPLGDFCPLALGVASPAASAAGMRVSASAEAHSEQSATAKSVAGEPAEESHPRIEELYEETKQIVQSLTAEDAKCLYEGGPLTPHCQRFVDLMCEILKIDPNNTSALSNLSQIRSLPPDESLRYARRLAEIAPGFDSVFRLGETLLKQGLFEEAVEVLEQAAAMGRAVDAQGHRYWLFTALAVAKANLGRFQEALEHAQAAIKSAGPADNVENAVDLYDRILTQLNRQHGDSR